jgi:hypothetical protein
MNITAGAVSVLHSSVTGVECRETDPGRFTSFYAMEEMEAQRSDLSLALDLTLRSLQLCELLGPGKVAWHSFGCSARGLLTAHPDGREKVLFILEVPSR